MFIDWETSGMALLLERDVCGNLNAINLLLLRSKRQLHHKPETPQRRSNSPANRARFRLLLLLGTTRLD